MTYKEARGRYGSDYRLARKVEKGELNKLARGVYSKNKHVSPYAIMSKLYPDAIITMDSAFFIHGLTDVVPEQVFLATKRNATRIKDSGIKQFFLENRLFEPGATTTEHDDTTIRIYSQERMLVELMRNSASIPLDYYKEIINGYRRRAETLDLRAIEDYVNLFKRNDYMFEILQKEVL